MEDFYGVWRCVEYTVLIPTPPLAEDCTGEATQGTRSLIVPNQLPRRAGKGGKLSTKVGDSVRPCKPLLGFVKLVLSEEPVRGISSLFQLDGGQESKEAGRIWGSLLPARRQPPLRFDGRDHGGPAVFDIAREEVHVLVNVVDLPLSASCTGRLDSYHP